MGFLGTIEHDTLPEMRADLPKRIEFHLQIAMPKAKVLDILREVHNVASGGHPSVKKILINVREILLDSLSAKCTRLVL